MFHLLTTFEIDYFLLYTPLNSLTSRTEMQQEINWFAFPLMSGSICGVCRSEHEVRSGRNWALCESCYGEGYRVKIKPNGNVEYEGIRAIFSGPDRFLDLAKNWSGIPEVNRDMPCKICGSTEEVFHRQVPITGCALTKEFETGSYIQSSLCQKCIHNGWILLGDTAFGARLTYYNVRRGGFKYSS